MPRSFGSLLGVLLTRHRNDHAKRSSLQCIGRFLGQPEWGFLRLVPLARIRWQFCILWLPWSSSLRLSCYKYADEPVYSVTVIFQFSILTYFFRRLLRLPCPHCPGWTIHWRHCKFQVGSGFPGQCPTKWVKFMWFAIFKLKAPKSIQKKLHFLLIRTGQDDLDCWKRRVCRKRRRNEQ